MLDETTVSLLESGSALLVGLVSAEGEPVAGRAWGLRVIDATSAKAAIRVLLSGHDVAVAQVEAGSTIAITGTDVATFQSTQVKGVVRTVEAPVPEDLALSAAYIDAYFGAISRGDAAERKLLGRMHPGDVRAVTVHIDTAFDQTPGPGAGAALETRTPSK